MALPIESLQIRQMGDSIELYFQKNQSTLIVDWRMRTMIMGR